MQDTTQGYLASGTSAMKKSINLTIEDLMKPLYTELGALDKNSTAPVQMSLEINILIR